MIIQGLDFFMVSGVSNRSDIFLFVCFCQLHSYNNTCNCYVVVYARPCTNFIFCRLPTCINPTIMLASEE